MARFDLTDAEWAAIEPVLPTDTRGVDLRAAIKRYIAGHNRRAKPFVWTKPATDILAAVSRTPEPSV